MGGKYQCTKKQTCCKQQFCDCSCHTTNGKSWSYDSKSNKCMYVDGAYVAHYEDCCVF